MGRLVALLAVCAVACAKHHDAPPSPLQDGAAVAVAIDAPPVAADAPPPREPPTATKVVVGAHASCAILSDATVRCWGGNTEGQLGDGSTRSSTTPVAPNVRGVKDLVLGEDFACALIDDTSVVCWGKIGYGKDHRLLAPAAAPGVRDIVGSSRSAARHAARRRPVRSCAGAMSIRAVTSRPPAMPTRRRPCPDSITCCCSRRTPR